jgi:hypothetical protein
MLAKIVSFALANFEFAIDDVKRLLKLHDAETKRHSGRPSRQIEFFKRAAIILSVTAWESFIEDTIRSCGRQRIAAAASPFRGGRYLQLDRTILAPTSAQASGLGGLGGRGMEGNSD